MRDGVERWRHDHEAAAAPTPRCAIAGAAFRRARCTCCKLLSISRRCERRIERLTRCKSNMGDGTSSVVVLASELLRLGTLDASIHQHPMQVIDGLLAASREACRYLAETVAKPADALEQPQTQQPSDSSTRTGHLSHLQYDTLVRAAATALASKSSTLGDRSLFAQLAVDSVLQLHRASCTTTTTTTTTLTPQLLCDRISFVYATEAQHFKGRSFLVQDGVALAVPSGSIAIPRHDIARSCATSQTPDTLLELTDAKIFLLDGCMYEASTCQHVEFIKVRVNQSVGRPR